MSDFDSPVTSKDIDPYERKLLEELTQIHKKSIDAKPVRNDSEFMTTSMTIQDDPPPVSEKKEPEKVSKKRK